MHFFYIIQFFLSSKSFDINSSFTFLEWFKSTFLFSDFFSLLLIHPHLFIKTFFFLYLKLYRQIKVAYLQKRKGGYPNQAVSFAKVPAPVKLLMRSIGIKVL